MADSLRVGQLYTDLTVHGVSNVTSALDRVRSHVFKLRDAIATIAISAGLVKLVKSLAKTGAEFETYRKRLLAVTQDQRVANQMFEELSAWAAKNPIDTDDAIAAFVRLKSAAVANTREAIVAVGNLSALMDRSMVDTADALVAVNARTLRTFGIQLTTANGKARIQIGKTVKVVQADLQSVRQGIVSAVQETYGGVMDSMRDTWSGNVATMRGMWTEFMRDLAGSESSRGPFESLKNILIDLRKRWEAWVGSEDYKIFLTNFHKIATEAISKVGSAVEWLAKWFKYLLEHIDGVCTALKALATFKVSQWVLQLAGVTGPTGLLIAGGAALLEAGNDYFRERDEQRKKAILDEEAKMSEEALLLKRVKEAQAQIKENEKNQLANDSFDGFDGFDAFEANKKLAQDNDALKARIKEYNARIEELRRLPKKPEIETPKTKTPDNPTPEPLDDNITSISTGAKGQSAAEKRLEAVKAVVQQMRDEITYAGASASDFLPTLNALLSKYPAMSDEWKALKDLQMEGMDELKTKAEDSAKRIVEAEDWRYSVGETSAEAYFTTLKARYQDAVKALSENTSDAMQDQLTGQMRSAYEGLQSVTLASLDELKEKFDAGAISTDTMHEAAVKLREELISLGIQPPKALDRVCDGTDKAKSHMEALNEQTKKWVESFQEGITDAIVEGKNFADVLTDIGKEIEKMLLKTILFGGEGFGGLFGGLFGSLTGKVPAHHTGGVIGADAPSFFRRLLPKYHTGGLVGAGEELAVLRKNEAVFTPGQMKALGAVVSRPRSGDIKVEVNVDNSGYGNMSDEQARELGATVKGVVKAQVAEELYAYGRSGFFRPVGAM